MPSAVIKVDAAKVDNAYEVGLSISDGVNRTACGSEYLTMGRTIAPVGEQSWRHYHPHCEVAGFVIAGTTLQQYGDGATYSEGVQTAGDYYYIPRSDIHAGINQTDEDVRLVFAYSGVGEKSEAGTVFVEGPQVEPALKDMPRPRVSGRSVTIPAADVSTTEASEGLTREEGVSGPICGAETVTMGRWTLAAGGTASPSKKSGADTGGYVLSGRVQMFFGDQHNAAGVDAVEGDFFFVAPEDSVRIVNCSESDEAVLLFAEAIREDQAP